ncbi:hypothetical protein CB0940_03709 [Cercospora beticola]|uniref:Uncharacterized protein n=1 Tax=Cercospora beticola TaxID=122368 RepID=A0A2G5I3N8_CERBT|nr:hypothetical protein CB0940_03709 [Cercospora beticola]PIA99425.1 hypothetical protein CB0940_03709 [Cercospora beticola]WPB00893.1 hypothetical protein RHO25_005513 [Cercospora beticola]CAK1360860.1 unnamed protein product [Cercospora beticola]
MGDNARPYLELPSELRRKPVPLRHARSTPILNRQGSAFEDPPRYDDLFYSDPYAEHSRPNSKHEPAISEQEVAPDFDQQLKDIVLVTETTHEASEASSVHGRPEAEKLSTKLNHFRLAVGTAVNDAKHFAGGLIPHPYEATKHYSILRHSLGVVYYRGLTTRATITIFSDRGIPATRQLWLQKRGFSGKTGLALGAAMGVKSAWINVTPVEEVTSDRLPPGDERAWQRDITKFLSKVKDTKSVQNHRPCETLVVRIPFACQDGYFRIVLCDGKKVLCPSPVFRCASTSCDPSVLRGASLRTLPLELGIKAGAVVAGRATAAASASHKAIAPTVSLARSVTKSEVMNEVPMHWLGIRSDAMLDKCEEFGRGGVYIRR